MQCPVSLQLFIAAAILAASAAHSPAAAYTDQEIAAVFKGLDADGDGKVTRIEYETNKVLVIYLKAPVDVNVADQGPTFRETGLSRQYFDSLDKNHDGRLSPTEIVDGLAFEKIDTDNKGYFTRRELQAFMKSIGR